MEVYKSYINSIINIPNIGRGKLKYIGQVENKQGIFCGFDLLGPNLGKNDGSFNGKKYFDVEYVKSGLFVQFIKIQPLLDQQNQHYSLNNNSVNRGFSTPNRNSNGANPTTTSSSRSSSVIKTSNINNIGNNNNNPTVPSFDEKYYQNEILKYQTLLNDQSVILEEIQPCIDQYEKRLTELETENKLLKETLASERSNSKEQKDMLENEHEQLMSLVDSLHVQIKSIQESQIQIQDKDGDEDFMKYKQEQELYKKKWEKERDSLQMHINSLNTEYTNLNKELLENEQKYKAEIEDLTKKLNSLNSGNKHNSNSTNVDTTEVSNTKYIDTVENIQNMNKHEKQYNTASTAIIQSPFPKTPITSTNNNKKDLPTASVSDRPMWCALCERTGHESIDCPFE
ncbi:uncharacterized protein SCODWIG_00809 [Saccharomycodes ludwigii]|uniref:CAP-Gly domain-containing protein n=1 Tax=Saccharomycodes ludwigii TaxID=36035 RepID=A0A376B2Y7_9ASCO|nr:hypothetical protein SCDLUD_003854 [Saccharomycodes ludwigii]KAH3899574.1 hypothetical protein SCDLUD_003854 [Saccharomycodes ludwigii]SSD59048.1 uncharacterized protein SCODWIG_00809 [Saccharomycodes ludwigii]